MKPVFALTALMLMWAIPAQAEDVQRWMSTDQSRITINASQGGGGLAEGKMVAENVAADIAFDPRNLKGSKITLSVIFTPLSLPNGQKIDQDIRAAGQALFESSAITKTGDTTFEALGMFNMNGRQQQLILPLTVSGGEKNGKPTLTFTGTLNAPIGKMAPTFALPAYVPVDVVLETVATP